MNSLEQRQKLPVGRVLQGNLTDHIHNGTDASRVNFKDLKNVTINLSHTIQGSNASTATNYGVFFINQIAPCYVSKFYEVHQTKGTDAGTVTLMLEKLTGTTAPDSGSSVLASALSLKANDNTVQTAVISTNLSNINLAIGDRLCLKDSGILTSLVNVTVFVELTLT